MNQLQLDTVSITGIAHMTNASILHADLTTCASDSLSSSFLSADKAEFYDKITIGNHTFDAEELGNLLQYLIDTHPELKV